MLATKRQSDISDSLLFGQHCLLRGSWHREGSPQTPSAGRSVGHVCPLSSILF
jgi:hypothetical protein